MVLRENRAQCTSIALFPDNLTMWFTLQTLDLKSYGERSVNKIEAFST
jgi:hypothetical protein